MWMSGLKTNIITKKGWKHKKGGREDMQRGKMSEIVRVISVWCNSDVLVGEQYNWASITPVRVWLVSP